MNEHPERELAAAYALGTLDAAERDAFEAHLATCDACRADVRAYGAVTGLLGQAVPDAAPPPGLRDRVLAEARRVRPIGSARRGLPAPWLTAAAATTVAVATALWAWLASARVRTLGRELAESRAAAAASESTFTAMIGARLHVVSLAAEGQRPVARVFWNHDRNAFVVTAFALPPAPAGREYQLWAIADGHAPVSMGTFNTDADGHATAVLPVDPAIVALGFIKLCGLTEEPDGGSPQPTEAPRLAGAWSHAD